MKNLKVWAATILILFAVAGCETQCEKKRPLNPTEKAWIESHPDGELRDGPEDFAEFAIKDRCDPTIGVPWQWKHTVSAEEDKEEVNPFAPKPPQDNKPPVAVMVLELVEGTDFKFSGLKSYDKDDGNLKFQWLVNYKQVSAEPEVEITLKKGEVYHVILNVWNLNEGDRSGNSYKMGSTVDFMIDVDKVTCPEE